MLESIFIFLLGLVIAIGILFVVGFIVAWPIVWIWNYLAPDLFGLPEIMFWQAFWLYFLCGILLRSANSSSKSS